VIDFRFQTGPLSPEDFLGQFADGREPLPMAAFVALDERLRVFPTEFERMVTVACRFDNESFANFLDGAFEAGRPETLHLAERALRRRGLDGMEPWLIATLAQSERCRWLVDILAEIHEQPATRILLQLLDHPSDSIRRRAADGLASHRTTLDGRRLIRHLAEPLVRGLDAPDPLIAVRCLQRLADPALEPDFGMDLAHRSERVLINCVRHEKRPQVRGDAVASLGEIGSRNGVRCLVDMLHREESALHREVVIALRKIHPDRALMALLSLLQSRDPIIREEAANALGAIGDPAAAKRLRALIEDESADVRQEAVLALGKLGGSDVLSALELALADRNPAVRAMACHALAESVGTAAQGKLIAALYDASADVRGEAAFHLGNVGDENARTYLEAVLVDGARDCFGDRISGIARRALFRLERAREQRRREMERV
jgi:HEAT repeat protein